MGLEELGRVLGGSTAALGGSGGALGGLGRILGGSKNIKVLFFWTVSNWLAPGLRLALAANTAHVLRLNRADVLALNKAHVLRLNKASFFGQVEFLGKIKACLACKQPSKEDKIKTKLTWEGSR